MADLILASDVTTYRLDATDSTKVSACITLASGLIEAYCDRVFASTSYAEWLRVDNERYLQLSQYPVVDGSVCRISAAMDAVTVTLSSSAYEYNSILVDKTKLHLSAGSSTTSLTLASYATMALLVAAMSSPWSGVVVHEGAASTLRPCAVALGKTNASHTLQCAGELVDNYEVYQGRGTIDLKYHRSTWLYASYTAGYATIPAVVKQVASQLTVDLCASSAANPLLESESLGDYSYKLRTGGQAFVAPYADTLAPYVRRSL